MRSVSLRGLEAEARERLDHAVYDFFAGAAEDETTMRANEAAYARIGLVPRVLRGCGAPELGVSLLGRRLETPVLVAPTAFHRLAHPDGECATARACAAAGTVMIAAMASTVPIAEIVAAGRERAPDSPAPWFQLYIQPDLDFTGAIVGRAEAAGCGALSATRSATCPTACVARTCVRPDPALYRLVRGRSNSHPSCPGPTWIGCASALRCQSS
jgi:4-hydroxymandelate oxidase